VSRAGLLAARSLFRVDLSQVGSLQQSNELSLQAVKKAADALAASQSSYHAQQLRPRDCMAKVKLSGREFDVDSEDISASCCGVTDADCVALAARIKAGEMRRLKNLDLVRLFSVLLNFPHPHLSSALFHRPAITSATTARVP
jgi:hypothetical protein